MSGGTRWDFRGRVAVVTGASRGIGLGIASLLVEGGADVVITGRRQYDLDRAADALGTAATTVCGAVDAAGHAEDVVSTALTRHGRLDYLVNNAATNPVIGPLHHTDIAAFDKTWQVNVRAPLVLVQATWDGWMAAHGGVICNVASVGGLRTERELGSYNVSKAALLHLTRQLALDMAPSVRVNAVAPGVVRTDFARPLYEGDAELTADYPVGRLGEPSDVAAAVAYLLSDDAGWITGSTLVLDGGSRLASRPPPPRPMSAARPPSRHRAMTDGK